VFGDTSMWIRFTTVPTLLVYKLPLRERVVKIYRNIKNVLIFAVLAFVSLQLFAQESVGRQQSQPVCEQDDTLRTQQTDAFVFVNDKFPKKGIFKQFIVPTMLVSFGVATGMSESVRKLDMSMQHSINKHFSYRTSIDDYSQYAPAIAVFGMDIAGLKAEHSFKERLIVMATSYIIESTVVNTMKASIDVYRPDNSANNSFPSGHTATAFVGAHLLYKEYSNEPLVYTMGYLVAAGTGAMRVLNIRHWISDVVAGAGIGMLCVESSYLLLPVFRNMFGIESKEKSLVVVPSIEMGNLSINIVFTF
jgi:hypothetical protein